MFITFEGIDGLFGGAVPCHLARCSSAMAPNVFWAAAADRAVERRCSAAYCGTGSVMSSAHLPGGRNRCDWPLEQPLSAIRHLAVGSKLMIA